MVSAVTDPKLLAQLNASGPVTDPELLAQLNGRRRTDPKPEETYDPKAGMNWAEKALVGAGAGFDRTLRGVTGLLEPILPQEFADANARGAEDAKVYRQHHPGGAATAGEIAGDVALSAIPVAGISAKVAPLLSKALGRFAPAAADITTNAAYGGATAPDGERALAATLGGAGAAGAKVLTKALAGATPGVGAQHLLDSGIQPTFGQVVGETGGRVGRGIRNLEAAGEVLPLAGHMFSGNRERALQQFREAMLPEAKDLGIRHVDAFTPKEMIRSAHLQGEPVPKLAEIAERVMGSKSTEPTARQTLEGGAILGSLGMLAFKPTATALGAATGYALPVTQRALTGQTAIQKAVKDFALLHPEVAHLGEQAILQIMRASATQGAR